MRFQTIHLVAGLVAAIAFLLAFIAAGIVILSTLFMILGLAAVAWLAWSLIRQVRARAGNRAT